MIEYIIISYVLTISFITIIIISDIKLEFSNAMWYITIFAPITLPVLVVYSIIKGVIK